MASYNNVSPLSQRLAPLFNNVSLDTVHPDNLALLEYMAARLAESDRVQVELPNNPDASALREIIAGLTESDRVELNIGTISGSGLSEEKILEHLNVTTTQGKKCEGEEVDSCAICLSEYEENEKMATLRCGHGFHVECIKSWLLRKNVCPTCRATALTV
ncbi:putative zinc finger, RING/FYVE/PHD-type containing protein [Tanacetum coccineum]